jgi:mono/diheme cytochrome c family protein
MTNLRVLGGAVGAVAGLALLAGSVMANTNATGAAAPSPHPEPRVLVAQADTAMPKATYTNEQADRGEEDFGDNCVECHGDDLRGGLLGGPPLRGQAFEGKYANGAPAGVLFEIMSSTMPPNDPGRYSPETYADIMAYILKRNGFPTGAALPSDIDALYNLVIAK